MGAKTQILLVIALLLTASGSNAGVKASEHHAFWLWSGVAPTSEMKNARLVYLHQGEVNDYGQGAVFQKMGMPASKLHFPALWVTIRFTTLNVPPRVIERLIQLLENWRKAGNHIVGLQLDFDAATRQLHQYATFLRTLRAALPADYALGVTGLLDWAQTGDVGMLNALPIDELVVQSYQGRKTVVNYADYLPALNRLRIPFKIGVVQYGDWESKFAPEGSTWYRGTVVFMLNTVRP